MGTKFEVIVVEDKVAKLGGQIYCSNSGDSSSHIDPLKSSGGTPKYAATD